MGTKERAVFALIIWLAVYPSVLIATWVLNLLETELALPVRILITTAFTVPLLEFVVIPRVKGLVAKAEREFEIEGELRRKQEGPPDRE